MRCGDCKGAGDGCPSCKGIGELNAGEVVAILKWRDAPVTARVGAALGGFAGFVSPYIRAARATRRAQAPRQEEPEPESESEGAWYPGPEF